MIGRRLVGAVGADADDPELLRVCLYAWDLADPMPSYCLSILVSTRSNTLIFEV